MVNTLAIVFVVLMVISLICPSRQPVVPWNSDFDADLNYTPLVDRPPLVVGVW